MKIGIEVQVYVPTLEPAAPIRLADRNHAHYPSRHCTIHKNRWLNDGLPERAIGLTLTSMPLVLLFQLSYPLTPFLSST